MKKIVIVVILLFTQKTTYAGHSKLELKLYKKAKKQYQNENYEEAKDMLESLLENQEVSNLELYVLFYYALALYRCGELNEAIETLQSVARKHPEWYNINEVWYWLGLFFFEKQHYELALETLNKFSDHDKSRDVQGLKLHFLEKCDDLEVIENFINKYPDDLLIAQILVKKISQEPIYKRKICLIERLAEKFGMYTKDIVAVQGMSSIKKESYNIAVFLPFFVEQLQDDSTGGTDFVISLYQGIKLAVTELEHNGIKINLYAYDTNRDPVLIANLLTKDEMKSMDAIIGPLYPEAIPLVSALSKEFGIPMFNPLSDNLELMDNNPFYFLYQSSIQTKAVNAAKYTLTTVNSDSKIGIVYSKTKSEILAANVYKNYIESNSTHRVDVMIAIEPSSSSTFLSYYIRKKKNDSSKNNYPYATIEELTHLYVPSKDEIIAASVISAAEIANDKVNIIADESWLSYESIAMDQILGLKVVFVSPTYVDYRRPNIYEFRDKFREEFADFPDSYAMKGYELMIFLGRMLNSHGSNFISEFRQNSTYDTNILPQIRYGLFHDNQRVPLAKIDNEGYVICYGG